MQVGYSLSWSGVSPDKGGPGFLYVMYRSTKLFWVPKARPLFCWDKAYCILTDLLAEEASSYLYWWHSNSKELETRTFLMYSNPGPSGTCWRSLEGSRSF